MVLPLLLSIAALVVGHPVSVTCETPAQWAADPVAASFDGDPSHVDGYTRLGVAGNPVVLSPTTCGALVVLSLDPDELFHPDLTFAPAWQLQTAPAEALAVLTLGHELWHSSTGSRDELGADCGGLAAMPTILQALGADDRLTSFQRMAHLVVDFSQQHPGQFCP